ncbi:MAG: FixH family protein [Allosphingosinicella sp.]
MTKRFTGWHMTAILLAFFWIIVAVNFTMATFATRTFGGVVVENSYVASQKYNGWLKAARKQETLGWKAEAALGPDRRVAVEVSLPGAVVTGYAEHPLGREADVPLIFTGVESFRSRNPLPAGRWKVHLLVRRGVEQVRLSETLS